ncbi:CoA-binding protein [Allokutzneria sp. A3M-2-11 16]|uniref:CoA-binding protein n=1 Tax=Allokutzneria sp. A3M-2-11 16 TaxID=2962043 RepID=UPI0020B8DBA5|nr:CoA-binding protein [Allokutzneria sp. A3M-2-11 16]MCP3798687.1 CoA-binding protein [Allokutzneria sp. A3M-2-11 16]
MSGHGESAMMEQVLRSMRTIAVVGASDRPDRPSHGVATYLQRAGFQVFAVNPKLSGELFGNPVHAALEDIPEPIDVVDVFRRPSDVPPVVESAIAVRAKAVWLQLGITNANAEARARDAGLSVIANRCLKVEHARLP